MKGEERELTWSDITPEWTDVNTKGLQEWVLGSAAEPAAAAWLNDEQHANLLKEVWDMTKKEVRAVQDALAALANPPLKAAGKRTRRKQRKQRKQRR